MKARKSKIKYRPLNGSSAIRKPRHYGAAAATTGVVLLPFLCVAPVSAQSVQPFTLNSSGVPQTSGSPQFSGATIGSILNASLNQHVTTTDPGKVATEYIRGNGTRTGYKLAHANVLTDTISIHLNVARLKYGTDFWVDADTGNLYFQNAVSAANMLSVYYRYIDAPVAPKQSSMFSGLELSLGGKTQLGFNFDLGFGSSKASMYGFNLNSTFGKNTGNKLGGMIYFGNAAPKTGAGALPVSANVNPLSGLKQFITQNVSMQSGKAHFSANFQDIAKNFGAFQSLKDAAGADKTALATLADLEKQKGLERSSFALGFDAPKGLPKTATGLSMQSTSIGDGKGALSRQSLLFDTGKLGLEIINRKIDRNFARIADLTDDDKTAMALDVRRQFEPGSTAAQVTAADKTQVVKEAGLAREGLHGNLALTKTNALNFSVMSLKPTLAAESVGGGIDRAGFGYSTKFFQMTAVNQSIANSFNLLPSLMDVEKAQFGNEHGLTKQSLGLNWQLSKVTKISFSDLHYGTSDDVLNAAYKNALASNLDANAYRRAANVGLLRRAFTYDSKNFSLAAHQSDVDQNFSRSADLALAAPDKKAIEADRGYNHDDITTHFTGVKGLTLDTMFSDATNPLEHIDHDAHKITALYNYGKYTKFNLADDSDLVRNGGLLNGTAHSAEAFNQNLGKGFMLNLTRDALTTYSRGAKTIDNLVEDLKFDTPQLKFGSMSYENKRISLLGGSYEDTSNLNVHLKPEKTVTMNFQRLDIDRDNKTTGSSAMDEFDVNWQATKQLAVVAGGSQTTTNNNTNADTVSIGLKGDPCKNLTLGAKFDEIHNTLNTKDVADFSVSNAKPVKFGIFSNIILTAKYSSLNDQRRLQNETMTGHLTFDVRKNSFLFDYAGVTLPNGTSTINRTYSFKTDPDVKRTFHFSFFYKDKTLITGKEALVRNFTADWKLSKDTNFVYAFGTSPEDAAGNIRDINTANISLKRALKKNGTLEGFYRVDDNRMTHVLARSIGLGYDRKVSINSHLNFALSKDANATASTYDHSDHLHIGFEQTVSADRSITLSTEFRDHDQAHLQDLLQVNLDYRIRF
jgi:hypothetical protein